MRIFVAGATGVLGRRLLPLLLAEGHQITALTRKPGTLLPDVETVQGDVFDKASLTEAVRKAQPDVVMHQLTDLAGRDFAANARIRITGTRNLVDAAQGVPKIIAQSIAWMYAPGDGPATEDVPLDRDRDIAAVKALEDTVREAPEWVVLRYGLFYGPGTWYHTDGLMADAARKGELIATGDVSSFVHIDDAASAAVAALDWESGAVNVTDDEPAPAYDWLPAFCSSVGAPPPERATDRNPWARGADNRRARQLGWVPRFPSWRTGFGA